jgi:holo-ACP synthase CitX
MTAFGFRPSTLGGVRRSARSLTPPRAQSPEPPTVSNRTTLRRALLEAREARQAAIARACSGARSVIVVSLNIPGAEKRPPGASRLARTAGERLGGEIAARAVFDGIDALGPWAILASPLEPAAAKRAAIEVETSLPAGRLLDLDVYDSAGCQIDRASIGLPARCCLVCTSPAVDCIRVRRHSTEEVGAAARRLLLRVLAAALVGGARAELDLTPKPGLVDRLDSGSHPDLSFEDMSRSIDLLQVYFDELLALDDPLDLPASVAAGRRAERRMVDAVGSNAHKGYIFLAGLVLLAAEAAAGREGLRSSVSTLARRVLDGRTRPEATGREPSHGDRLRASHGVGGIVREALLGLPAVFERGLPVLAASRNPETRHLLMAVLMQSVEDTTALHRCGPSGLARLRADGVWLERRIESGEDYLPSLAVLNDEYRRLNLTMGGVADCMALCFALDQWFA